MRNQEQDDGMDIFGIVILLTFVVVALGVGIGALLGWLGGLWSNGAVALLAVPLGAGIGALFGWLGRLSMVGTVALAIALGAGAAIVSGSLLEGFGDSSPLGALIGGFFAILIGIVLEVFLDFSASISRRVRDR